MSTNRDPLYQSFQGIFQSWYGPLCNFAYSFLKDDGASEDIVQDVFIHVWHERPDLIKGEGIRSYLFTAVRNNCITKIRRNNKGVVKPLDDEDGVDVILRDVGEETDYMSLVALAIDGLPTVCRRAFLLNKVAHMSYKEVAETLGISVKTVDNHLGKALRMIRVFLKEHGAWVSMGMPMLIKFFFQAGSG